MDKNNLFSSNQSGFRPNDPCIHHLIAITHNTFTAFGANLSLEVCGIFLDLFRAFDRVGMTVFFINSRVMKMTVTSLNLLNCF